ncbi:MAG: hypothetical protein VX796_09190 [Pseudomonadota bacterium]|nr:hypothetical protein [Pseudomonadota bacterium]
MKKSTIAILIAAGAFGAWAYTVKGEPVLMAELMRKAGHGVECESIEQQEQEWLSCRRGSSLKALWIRSDDDSGTTWVAADSGARRILSDIYVLPTDEKYGLPKTRLPNAGEDLPPAP